MICSITIPDDGFVGLRLEPYTFRTVAYKIKTDVDNVVDILFRNNICLNEEGWKDFHEGEDLQFEHVVLIIAKPTNRQNLNMMFVMNII